jgi:hypothetical protein
MSFQLSLTVFGFDTGDVTRQYYNLMTLTTMFRVVSSRRFSFLSRPHKFGKRSIIQEARQRVEAAQVVEYPQENES